MVEGVRASGIGAAAPLLRDGMKTVSGRFTVGDGAAPLQQQARLTSVAGIGLESILALQAVDEAAERDRAAHKRGTAMIAALTRLQRAMLADEDPSLAVDALHKMTGDGPLADDPALGAIVRSVVLRSRVEIARVEIARVEIARVEMARREIAGRELAQVGNAQVGNAQVGNAQVGNGRVGNGRVENAHVGMARRENGLSRQHTS
jgi:class II flagellar assembly regulator FliX